MRLQNDSQTTWWTVGIVLGGGLALALTGCPSQDDDADDDREPAPREESPVGVDLENKVVRVGALNDESGPAASIGRPWALGRRILVEQVNAGEDEILPQDWTIELVERDHAYNPQQAVQHYNEIRDEVLFIGTSFGTPNTLPLVPHLEQDGLVAFPASLSSRLAENESTPAVGSPYSLEAMRGMDWAVEEAGGADEVRAGIIYQQDDYGEDGRDGWRAAAEHHGVEIVAEQRVAPGDSDFTAPVNALEEAGANYVLLSTLPSATGPIVGTAAQLEYAPVWLGNTPAWIDGFFDPDTIPSAVLEQFYWISSHAYWGEDVPGMDGFLEAFEAYGGGAEPNFYILISYVLGLVQMEILDQQIEEEELSREAFKRIMRTIDDFDADGLIPPMDLTEVPYQTNETARILRPNFEDRSWEVVADYAAPQAEL